MRGLKHILLWGFVVAATGVATTRVSAQDESVEPYLRLFPAHTNSLMILRAKELKQSPKAEAEGWKDDDSSLWLAGTERLPGWVTTVVRGAHAHLHQSHREWSMSVAHLPESLPFAAIERASGQKTQIIHGRPCFLSPNNYYVTALTKDLVGVLRPADRADLAHWIDLAKTNKEPIIPDYLQKVAGTPGHVVLAYDLENTLDVWLLREWLKSTKTLKGLNTQVQSMSQLLETIEGVTLAITVTDKITADLKVDFKVELTPIADKVQPLLIEYLTGEGAMLEDLEMAEVKLNEDSIVLTMDPLSDSGFQRIMSLILSPSTEGVDRVAQSATPPAPGDDQYDYNAEPTVKDTKNYYDAIGEMLGDLEKRTGPNYLATAVWHERYAAKIDRLPITSVDPEMLKYGRETSARLVALAASLRGTPLQVNTLENAVTFQVQPQFGGGGWWGGGGIRTAYGPVPTGYQYYTNLPQIRAQQAQAVMAGDKERDQVWQIQIDERNKIRTDMYEKYKVDFGIGGDDKDDKDKKKKK